MQAPRLMLVFSCAAWILALPVSAGGGHSHEYGFGDVPGNPLIEQDATRCRAQTTDDPTKTCIVLYGHIFNLLDDFLSNTQRPPPGTPDLARGFNTAPTIEPSYDLNQLEMFSSPGFVEYQPDPTLQPLVTHPERGITSDVKLARDVPIFGYWYLSADFDELLANDPPLDVGVLPCVTVRMSLATGQEYKDENRIAEGFTTKTLVSAKAADEGQADPVATMPCTGDRQADVMYPEAITEFEVDMGLAQKDIPWQDGFVVFVEWFMHAPGDPHDADKIGGWDFNIHTGHVAPNRVVVPIMDPVRIESLEAVPFADKLFLQATANSPWGSYDIDPTNVTVTVLDASGAPVDLSYIEPPILRYDTTHHGHFLPVIATFPWDYQKEGLAPGTYTVQVTVHNWQHTASATAERQVVITDQAVDVIDPTSPPIEPKVQGKKSPGVGLPGALLVLAGLGLVRARRR